LRRGAGEKAAMARPARRLALTSALQSATDPPAPRLDQWVRFLIARRCFRGAACRHSRARSRRAMKQLARTAPPAFTGLIFIEWRRLHGILPPEMICALFDSRTIRRGAGGLRQTAPSSQFTPRFDKRMSEETTQ
jgi:hypothetical protein